MNGNGNIKRIDRWIDRQLPPCEDVKIVMANDSGNMVRAIDCDGNEWFFTGAGGADLNGLFTASNSGGTIPAAFTASLTDTLEFDSISSINFVGAGAANGSPIIVKKSNGDNAVSLGYLFGNGLVGVYDGAGALSTVFWGDAPSWIDNDSGLVIGNSILALDAEFEVYGVDDMAANHAAIFRNASGDRIMRVRNDEKVIIGNSVIPGSDEFLTVQDHQVIRAETGNAQLNIDAISGGVAFIKVNAQDPNRDASIAFANAQTSKVTLGWDDSDDKFKMGTLAVNVDTFYEYDPINNRMRFNRPAGFNTNPNAASQLELNSSTQGFRIMRMTAAQASAIAAVDGLMLYVNSTNVDFPTIGFYGYEAGSWVKL